MTLFRSIPIDELKSTDEFKNVEVTKLSGKDDLSNKEVAQVMVLVVHMKIIMRMLEKLNLLHNGFIEAAHTYIPKDADREKFFNAIIKGVQATKVKRDKMTTQQRREALTFFQKVLHYNIYKNKMKQQKGGKKKGALDVKRLMQKYRRTAW